MAEQIKYIYENVPLSFEFNNELVTGILDGSYKIWTFTSESPAFLKVMPKARLSNSQLWLNPIPDEVHDLFDMIEKAAEKAGYDMRDTYPES